MKIIVYLQQLVFGDAVHFQRMGANVVGNYPDKKFHKSVSINFLSTEITLIHPNSVVYNFLETYV